MPLIIGMLSLILSSFALLYAMRTRNNIIISYEKRIQALQETISCYERGSQK